MITIVFFLLVGLATFHFIYEGIIAPSLMLRLRFRIFRLRDDLRRLRIGPSPIITDEDFERHQQGLNNIINLLPYINLMNMREAVHALKRDKSLLEKSKKRVALLENCPSREAIRIYEQANNVLLGALLVSCGGWFLYIVPIIVAFLIIDQIKTFIQDLTTLPEADIKRIAPRMHRAVP